MKIVTNLDDERPRGLIAFVIERDIGEIIRQSSNLSLTPYGQISTNLFETVFLHAQDR